MSSRAESISFLKDLKEQNSDLTIIETIAEKLTTASLGGPVNLVQPKTLAALEFFIKKSSASGINFRILGAGSNLVISDSGVKEPVISLGKSFSGLFNSENFSLAPSSLKLLPSLVNSSPLGDKIKFIFGASTSLMALSRECTQLGLSGLEFAAGIPAELGGAVSMNAGAHGGEISNVFSRAWVINQQGKIYEKSLPEMNFSYRKSSICNEIVIAAELEFTVSDKEETCRDRRQSLEYRKKTQPLSFPSAGSVFKNPKTQAGEPQKSAGSLLEEAGFLGKKKGGAGYSDLHANWIVKNSKDAQASDFKDLLEEGRQTIKEKFGINLESEIKFWTE